MTFTVATARSALIDLLPTIAQFIRLRADVVESGNGRERLDELMRAIASTGAEVKGFAPLLLDFPADYEGEPVQLCWLEGDLGIAWYHRAEQGFAGRRPLPFDA
ncbi:MAG: DUF2203 domain-containing protein [Sporichthyaceae bacterium]